ncbi:MAG: SH3 domain-containing protein [Acidobacteria bacterium]|nr:SH3 domain-containing protein [Acidobacteriota bacterium]
MKKFKLLFLFLLSVASTAGCNTLAGKEETGVVIARRAQVRSSSAIVAADLKEVVRGDELDILDSTTASETNERWLRVRTRDAEGTEGWIEARNVISQQMAERSRQLAREDEGVPAQASGQLRASTNVRLSPDRSRDDNILMRLESGSVFDIISWKRMPKPKTEEETVSDDAPKAGAAESGRARRKKESDEPKEPEDTEELWYKVRLPHAISPAPAGWVYGKQVELKVPSDIIFYRTGREFVAWHKLDADEEDASQPSPKDKDAAAKDMHPGSWVILEKSSTGDNNGPDAPDFDRIYVLGYDKDRQEHYTAYRSPDLVGHLPLLVEGRGDTRTFIVKAQNEGQLKDVRFKTHFNERGLLKVEALDEWTKKSKGK